MLTSANFCHKPRTVMQESFIQSVLERTPPHTHTAPPVFPGCSCIFSRQPLISRRHENQSLGLLNPSLHYDDLIGQHSQWWITQLQLQVLPVCHRFSCHQETNEKQCLSTVTGQDSPVGHNTTVNSGDMTETIFLLLHANLFFYWLLMNFVVTTGSSDTWNLQFVYI